MTMYPGSGTVDGKVGDHILLAPAYNVTVEVIELIVRKTAAVIEECFQRVSRLDGSYLLNMSEDW